MKEVKYSINDTKSEIDRLRGVQMLLKVNLGRNKIVEYNGKIEDLYSSVFTVKTEGDIVRTYSYTDVLTGNVKLLPADQTN
jgi:uncharacterized protein Veg